MAAVLYTLCGAFVAITLCLPNCVCTERYACPQVCTCLGRMVDCSKRGLTDIPTDLPFWVEILSLQSNKIRELPESVFQGLGNVTELDLNNNQIMDVNSSIFRYMPSLKELKLSYNKLTAMPDIGRNGNLTRLMLAHNKIEVIRTDVIDQLPKLRELDLNFNKISELRKNTFPLHPSLHQLFLNNNKISVIEKGSLDNLTSMEWLKLNKNRLSGLPKELFSKLGRLRFLELNRNRLKTIDGLMFNGLENLLSLKLKRNGLTELMDGAFWGLSSIQNLELDHNNITFLRKGWLYGLASLQQLELSTNQIQEIEADSWECCGLLSQLDLTHNNMVSITEETFANLHSLKDLRLNFNKVSFIGDNAFTELSALESLDLSNNDISWTIEDMDGAFTGLVKLKRLGLNSNRIKSISKRAFSGLGQLHKLHLDDNNISSIQSNAFSPLTDIIELTVNSSNLLCDCQLSWLPGWLRESGFQNSVSLICSHPDTLKGKTIFDVEPQDFVCSDFPKPVIISEPESQMALKDSNVTLECTAASSGESLVEFAWKKDNKLMLDADVANTASTNTGEVTKYTTRLHIPNIQNDAEGRYQCIISNKLGATYSGKAQITVLVYPTFTKTPDDVTVRAGTTARLECAAMGHPQPVIAWQKNGGDDFPAARERRMHVMPEDDVFFIVNVKSSDQGIYSCTATNDAGTIVANATVNVLETPAFVKKMEDKTSVEGKTTVLECMASGSPKPKLDWHKDGKALQVTERHFFTAENQLLIIVQTKPSDSGTYTCVMSNTLGTERGTSVLSVISLSRTDEDGNVLNDDSTTTGIIIIAVVCCVVGTSLIWVIIIYQTRKKSEEYSPTPTDETTLPGEVPTPYHTDKEGSSSPGPRAPPYSTSFPRFGSHGRETYFNLPPGKAHLAALFLDECGDADHDHFPGTAQDSSISGLHRLQASDSDTIHSSSPSTHSTRSTHSTGVLQTFQPTPSHTPTSAPPAPPHRHDATTAVVHPGPPVGTQSHFVHIVDDGAEPHYGSRPPEQGGDGVYENMTFPAVTSTSQLSSSSQHPSYTHSLPKDSHGNSIKDRFTWHPSSPSSSSSGGSYDQGETAALLGSQVHRRPSSSSSLPPPQTSLDAASSQRRSLRIHDNPLATSDCSDKLPDEQSPPPSYTSLQAASSSATDAQSQVIPGLGYAPSHSSTSSAVNHPPAQHQQHLPHRTASPKV